MSSETATVPNPLLNTEGSGVDVGAVAPATNGKAKKKSPRTDLPELDSLTFTFAGENALEKAKAEIERSGRHFYAYKVADPAGVPIEGIDYVIEASPVLAAGRVAKAVGFKVDSVAGSGGGKQPKGLAESISDPNRASKVVALMDESARQMLFEQLKAAMANGATPATNGTPDKPMTEEAKPMTEEAKPQPAKKGGKK